MRHTRLLLCVLLFVMLAGIPASYGQQIVLSVDATAELGAINPYVYGANHGPWTSVSLDMLQAATDSGVTYLRFPAGNWGDRNNITTSQLDFFVLQARSWGAEPSVHVRLHHGTPEQAAELVRYANLEKDYNIRYWAIGNEPDLFEDYSFEQLNSEWRAIALAMLAVDPDIILIGPEVSQFPPTVEGDPYTNVRREMVRSFLEANGDLVDMVSIHRYPFPRDRMGAPTTIEDLQLNAPEWDTLVENLRVVMRETLGTELPMAITEVNSHWSSGGGAPGTPDSYYHAIWWSDVLGRLIRQQVQMVNYFALSTSASVSAFGLLSSYEPRPTYYTYQLYQRLGQTLLASQSNDQYVTVTAARHDDGTLTMIITNLYLEPQTVTLQIENSSSLQASAARLLAPDLMAQEVAPDTLLAGNQLTIPGQSAVLLIFPE